MRFHAKYVSVGESGGEYFAVSFDNEDPSNDYFNLSGDEDPYLIVQRQFEDDDGGVCYIETHDHDTYSGHFRLRLIRFTPTRFAFEIAREDHTKLRRNRRTRPCRHLAADHRGDRDHEPDGVFPR